jgi:hypothetical protein
VKAQPHSTVYRFERLILRPLDFLFYAVALYYLWHWHHAWAPGLVILVLSLGVGAIGQGLPHRKHETTSEMVSDGLEPYGGPFEGDITLEEARGLGRAAVLVGMLVGLTSFIILFHEGAKWFVAPLGAVAIGLLFCIGSSIVALGPNKIAPMLKRNGS